MPTAEKVVIPEDKEVNDDDAEQDDDEEEEEDDAGDSVANGEDGASEKSSKARVKKCHEEIETCGLCGKNSSEFNSLKSFHMHIAWCYRRRNNMDPPKDLTRHKTAQSVSSTGNSIPTTGSSSVGTKRKNESSTEPEKKKSKSTSEGKSSSAKAKATAEVVTSGTPVVSSLASLSAKAVDEGASDAAVVTADSFAPGYHYETCEVCKEHGEVVLCDSCPCVYHQKCVEKMFTLPSGKWFCPKCNESGAASGKVMPNEMKSKNLVDEWILIYSSALHRWRKAVVIGQRSGKNSTVLVKWWRSDNRGGKTNWVDISKPKILLAEPEKVTSSRSRPSQAASQSAQRQKVKFEDEQRKAMEKYKSQGKGMLMDGDTEGTAPPGVAVGVGGVTIGTDMINNVEEETKTTQNTSSAITDTYISTNSVKAALCAAGTACRAVDIAMCNKNTNVFACTRPPGHHAGRYGCTAGCLSTGFCLLNNAAIAMVYSRVRWGLERVAVVDIDVHFGNGTAEILKGDPGAFFASVHMIYGDDNDGNNPVVAIESSDQATRSTGLGGFYPSLLGKTEITDNYVSVGVFPSDDIKLRGSKNYKKQIMPVLAGDDSNVNEYDMDDDADSAILDEDINKAIEPGRTHIGEVDNECNVDMEIQSESKEINSGVSSSTERKYPTFVGSTGFIAALTDVIIPQMEKFKPELLIISGRCYRKIAIVLCFIYILISYGSWF